MLEASLCAEACTSMRLPFLHESRSKTMKIYLSFQAVLTSYKLLEIERSRLRVFRCTGAAPIGPRRSNSGIREWYGQNQYRGLRGTAWHKRQGIAGVFGSGARAARLVQRACFLPLLQAVSSMGTTHIAQFIRICRWLQLIHENRLTPLENAPVSTP
jgi:hypothetical protein